MFFYFNSKKFDFWKIYDCIKHYYPLGVKRDESNFFFTYPGIIESNKLILDNIINPGQFEKLENFRAEIELNVKKNTVGTTYGQAPCYSGYIEIDSFTYENHTRTKELHFFVSLLGPFYTIIGKDNNSVTIDWATYTNPTYLIISPEREYFEDFNLLQSMIEHKFDGYKFVPYDIYHQSIDGLVINYDDGEYNTVFNGIFNTQIDFRVQKMGDQFYKYDSWLKK